MKRLTTKNSKLKYLISINLFMMFLCIAAFQIAAQNLNLDTTFSGGVTDAPPRVYSSTTLSNGKILVGGNFAFVNGVQKSFLILLNPDGTIDNSFNAGGTGPSSSVYEIVELSTGKILITGSFGTYNGVAKGGIARLNADGSLDTTFNQGGAGVTGTIQGISLQTDGKILISGSSVVSYNGIPRFSIMRLNADGTLDESFVSPFTSAQFIEEVDVQSDGKILIGGGFVIGNPSTRGIARLNSDGSLDSTFNTAGGVNTNIYAMAIQPDGKILIGGDFDFYGGIFTPRLARLNTNGSLDTASDIGSFDSASVEFFAIQPDGKILITGNFVVFGTVYPVARINADGTGDNTFIPPTSDYTGYNVKIQPDGKILLTGFFTTINGSSRRGMVRLNSDGSVDNSFNASFNDFGLIDAVVQQPDGKIIVGGSFEKANGTTSVNVARFNANGTLDTTFQSGTGTAPNAFNQANQVFDIALQPDGKILVGGTFGSFNGVIRPSIVRLNSDGTVDTSFNANFFDPIFLSYTYDIFVQSDGKILIGGLYFGQSNFTFNGLFRLNSNGSLDQSFNNGSQTSNSYVFQIVPQSDGKYVIGGSFTGYSGTARSRIARINNDGTLDTSFDPGTGANGTIWEVALQSDGKILIGGAFTLYNGTSRNRFVRLNTTGTLDNSFNTGTGANGTVYTILPLPDGKILIGGFFSTYNGNNANRLARINADGSFDNTFVSGLENKPYINVRDLLMQTDGKIVLGGVFDAYGGIARNSLARLTATTPVAAKFDFDGDGRSDISVFRPTDSVWYLNRSTAGFTGVTWGIATDKITPADFDGDGKTDVAVFRPESGTWYWIRSSDNAVSTFNFGLSEDVPVPADYDGDGTDDIAVFRPSNSVWYIQRSQQGFYAEQFGLSTDKSVPADYDGDGKTDIAVYREGVWYQQRSSQGFTAFQFGLAGDKPVASDYDGDGRADAAVYRDGTWYILGSTQGFYGFPYGIATDIPAPADYDGDGKTDAAVYRDGVWYQLLTQSGSQVVQFGLANDKPVPSAFLP